MEPTNWLEPKFQLFGRICPQILVNNARVITKVQKGPPLFNWRAIFWLHPKFKAFYKIFTRADTKSTRAIFFELASKLAIK